MITKMQVQNRDPAEQVIKVLDSLRVIRLALAGGRSLDDNDFEAVSYTLRDTIGDLEHVASLLGDHPLQWDGTLPPAPATHPDPDGGPPNVTNLRKAA